MTRPSLTSPFAPNFFRRGLEKTPPHEGQWEKMRGSGVKKVKQWREKGEGEESSCCYPGRGSHKKSASSRCSRSPTPCSRCCSSSSQPESGTSKTPKIFQN